MDVLTLPHLAISIEDEIPLCSIYAKALERAGFRTLEYYDGQVAMDALGALEEPPSLVVLDLNLPNLPGREILRFIRAEPRFSGTHVFLATSDSPDVTSELEENSDLVLFKPISFSQLRDLASRFY